VLDRWQSPSRGRCAAIVSKATRPKPSGQDPGGGSHPTLAAHYKEAAVSGRSSARPRSLHAKRCLSGASPLVLSSPPIRRAAQAPAERSDADRAEPCAVRPPDLVPQGEGAVSSSLRRRQRLFVWRRSAMAGTRPSPASPRISKWPGSATSDAFDSPQAICSRGLS
jgi:hypothetical protein